jgi:hypothetical protein
MEKFKGYFEEFSNDELEKLVKIANEINRVTPIEIDIQHGEISVEKDE